MRTLGRNIAWLLKNIRRDGAVPPPAPRPAARRLRRFNGAWRGPHPATRNGE